jgi:ribonuclease Z
VIIHDEFRFLVDCGEGTQRQILQSGLGFKRLNHVLITHGHLDHILGLAGLLSTFMRWETIDKLEILGGQWALDRIYDLIYGIVLRGAKPPMDLQLVQIKAGTIFDDDDFTVTAFPVWHRGPDCFGYLFEEKTHRPFLPEKADALEIPPGPWRRDLVSGKAITLQDGRVIHPDQVLGEERPGTRLAHVGDVGRIDELAQFVHDVDVLIIEATYMHAEAEMAEQFAHLTARQAAELAASSGIKHLILTHISRRYRERDVLGEAQEIFPNTVVARDFDTFQVRRGECVKVEQVKESNSTK